MGLWGRQLPNYSSLTFGLEEIMYRVWLPSQQRWIVDVPVTEALVYKEEGYTVQRMDLPYETLPR